jgi:UDP-2,3-diacylglucosamine pyrophosphatase LpxH
LTDASVILSVAVFNDLLWSLEQKSGEIVMNSMKRLSHIFESSVRLPIDDSSRLIIMSDCHRGDGSQADDFFKNENLYISALNHYFEQEFTYIEVGDGDELWENKRMSDIIYAHQSVFELLKKFYEKERVYFVYGNHDMVKQSDKFLKSNLYEYYDKRENKTVSLFENMRAYEGLVLEYKSWGLSPFSKEILLVHGHQVDDLNSSLWKLSRFLVRYVWRPLELFGVNNPTSPAQNQEKKEIVGNRLTEWVVKENHMLIGGHNHRPMFPDMGEPLYFNDGSCVHPQLITGIEIDRGEISLVKWSVKVKQEGSLYVGRDVIAGPKKLRDFFMTKRIFETCTLKDLG